jgi:8-amino-7-oxononanoate synthase
MLDFTSALYLGLRHPSWSLRPWTQFTTGAPAALRSPVSTQMAAQQVAALQGCEAGTLGTSTLHVFWDLFGILARERVAIYVDAGTYPIARWGVERAAARSVATYTFAHHDPDALRRQLNWEARTGIRPVVVTDGFCPGCGKPAPLAAYLESVRVFGGQLVLDDTQALGIFGSSPGYAVPYGRGGGGMLRWSNINGSDLLVVSSLAKAFGVPVAVLAGTKLAVREFEEKSETRVHCSPPSVAVVHATRHALEVNGQHGDALRSRLASLVTHFRQRTAEAGFRFNGGLFPVQTLMSASETEPARLHDALQKAGIPTVLHQARNGHGPRISFLITARHAREEIDRVAGALTEGSILRRHLEMRGRSHASPGAL